MKKKSALRVFEAAVFCALLLAALLFVTKIVERKASVSHLKPFIDHAEEYDVLFVGDSLVINGIFPMEMWEEYGIAGYNLASYGNTIPVTYWTLMNALDYASPKAVVIGIKDVEKSYKLTGSSSDLHTAFDGYPLSLTKIRAIEDLTDDPNAVDDYGVRYADMKWEYYFTLGKYHDRWSNLGRSDFTPELNLQKGGNMLIRVADEQEEYELIDEWDAAEENGPGFVYLRKMIEECRNRGIDVLLVHLPYTASAKAQRNANAVIAVAEEYRVGYIDFVSLDCVVDYASDCADSGNHLNASGAKKVTAYLAQYMTEHFGLPDRRQDARYAHWWDDYNSYIDVKRRFFEWHEELDDVLMMLSDNNFSAVVTANRDAPIFYDDQAYVLMHNAVRERVYEKDVFSMWSNALFPLEKMDEAAYDGSAYVMAADRKNGQVIEWKEGDEPLSKETSFGRLSCAAENGCIALNLERGGETVWQVSGRENTALQIVVIDDRTGKPVKAYSF